MKQLRYILALQALFVALFFFAERPAPAIVDLPDLPAPELSQQAMRAVAFIQPETARQVVSHVKTFSFSSGHLIDGFETTGAQGRVLHGGKKLWSQDINRCQRVSLLIFPHHLFW